MKNRIIILNKHYFIEKKLYFVTNLDLDSQDIQETNSAVEIYLVYEKLPCT